MLHFLKKDSSLKSSRTFTSQSFKSTRPKQSISILEFITHYWVLSEAFIQKYIYITTTFIKEMQVNKQKR